MIAKAAIVDLLGRTSLFGSLDEAERRAIADEMREVAFDPSQVIFARGDAGREIYLVVSGRVRISVLTAEGRELSFAHAEPGAIFGEIAMLDGGVRTRRRHRRQQGQRAQPVEAGVQAPDGDRAARGRGRGALPVLAHPRGRPAARSHRAVSDRRAARPLLPRRRARQVAGQRGGPHYDRLADVAERARACSSVPAGRRSTPRCRCWRTAAPWSVMARASRATSRSCKPSPAPSRDAEDLGATIC